MAIRRESQVTMLEHSKAKVLLLEKYLEKFFNVISNDGYTKKISVFDLFCGEGIYKNEGEGSPVVILRTLKQLHELNKGRIKIIPPIDLLFNDKDEQKIEKLKNIISEKKLHYEEYGKLFFRSKDYKEIIKNLSSFIDGFKEQKAFVFIDPYGYKEIRASEIKNLLLTKKAEVLLFLPTQFMYRFDEKGTPQSLIDIIEELVDLKEWKSTSSIYAFIEQFKDALKNYMGKDFFVDTFTIQKDEATVFCLFFFSSHIRGFEKMLETKWQIDEEAGKGWKYEKTKDLFAFMKTNAFEEKLIEYLQKEQEPSNGNVYEFTLHQGFLPKHATDIFTALQKNKQLEVISKDNIQVRKGAFYINYENYKKEFHKVYYKLNKQCHNQV